MPIFSPSFCTITEDYVADFTHFHLTLKQVLWTVRLMYELVTVSPRDAGDGGKGGTRSLNAAGHPHHVHWDCPGS